MKNYAVLEKLKFSIDDKMIELKKLIDDAFNWGYEQGYKDGEDDTWLWCGKYIPPKEDGGMIPVHELREIFEYFKEIFDKYTPFEAMQKIEEYETNKKVKAISVGDVVIFEGEKCIVVKEPFENAGAQVVAVWRKNGAGLLTVDSIERTDTHYSIIPSLLKELEITND